MCDSHWDFEPDPFDEDRENETACKHCGANRLHWRDHGSGWKLYDNNLRRHVCPAQQPSADDFNDLT